MDVSQLEKVATPKGEYLGATVTRKGRTAAEILAEALPKEIAGLYWPKNMYWRKRGELFVRPVRWLVAMLDEQVIPLEVFGIAAGKTSRGHRLLGHESRQSRGPAPTSKPCAPPKFSVRLSASRSSAKLSMLPRAQFPARAGAKMTRSSPRS